MILLETERLILRNIRPEDADTVFDYRNNEICARYQRGQTKDLPGIRALTERRMNDTLTVTDNAMVAVALKETGEMVGEIVVMPNDDCFSLGYTFHYAHHRRVLQCPEIVPLELFQTAVGVGICLEISKIGIGVAVSSPVELKPLVNLRQYVLGRGAVGGMEGGIVAEGASSATHAAVPVGAGESCIDDHFLQPGAVFLPKIVHIGIVAAPAGVYHPFVHHSANLFVHHSANLAILKY